MQRGKFGAPTKSGILWGENPLGQGSGWVPIEIFGFRWVPWGCPPDTISAPFLVRKGAGGWSKRFFHHPASCGFGGFAPAAPEEYALCGERSTELAPPFSRRVRRSLCSGGCSTLGEGALQGYLHLAKELGELLHIHLRRLRGDGENKGESSGKGIWGLGRGGRRCPGAGGTAPG